MPRRTSASPKILFYGIAAVLVVGLVTLAAVASPLFGQRDAAQPTKPPSAGWYEVYFTSPRFPDNPTERGGSLDEELVAFINSANSSIDMAAYQLDMENVTSALLKARKRNCSVRVVADIDILNDPRENHAFRKLQAAGVGVVGGNPNGIMHNRFVVVDDKAVWTGSWSFTDNATYRNDNNALLIQSPVLASNYTATFDKMWQDKQFSSSRQSGRTTPRLSVSGVVIESYFAPEEPVRDRLVTLILTAQRSIDFMAFSFTDDVIGEAIRARARDGVRVRGVFETTGSETRFSQYGSMKADRLDVLLDGNPYLMSHKVIIVDGRAVVLGSYDFSRNAQQSNDENLLIVSDESLAAHFTAEFERVYAQAKDPPQRQ